MALPTPSFPELLRNCMHLEGLTPVVLAKKINVDLSLVSRLLSGERELTLDSLVRLSDVFHWNETQIGRIVVMVASARKTSSAVKMSGTPMDAVEEDSVTPKP